MILWKQKQNVSDEHENAGEVYKMYYTSEDNNKYNFEASDLHDETGRRRGDI